MVEQMAIHKIQLLNQETIDKIAAGEVVERPSSVVKELVENAIDAGADAITIEIRDGGTSFIRITDNGCGIPAEQVPMAFLRHSTSKISSAEDLIHIHSLGFRGEALSSIAAVSHVELITKPADQLLGLSYVLEGGREVSVEEIGAPDGTTFFVRHLFYNTPARRKFLKSNLTEGNYIFELIQHLALSHPDIAFRFLSQGQEKLITSGSGSAQETIYQVFGKEISQNILEISSETSLFSVHGFIGKPVIAKGNRSFEHFYVQGRYIKSQLLSKSVEEGYYGFLMQHQYPFCCLHLDFPSGGIDVNVHPTKQEVRIEKGSVVYETLSKLIAERLSRREDIMETQEPETTELSSKKPVAENVLKSPEPFETTRLQEMKRQIRENIHKDTPYEPQYEAFYDKQKQSSPMSANTVNEQQTLFLSPEALKKHRIIGQVFETYWLVEFDEKLYIIDQHAAHEKVLYERTMKRLRDREMTSQMISPPIVVTLSVQETETYETYQSVFREMGFELSEFGGQEYAICAIPGNLFSVDPKNLFLNVLQECGHLKIKESYDLIMEKVASMSCKAAVKGNQRLSRPEIETLISELLTLDNPYHCPHGRPTIISITRQEMEKKFKRII